MKNIELKDSFRKNLTQVQVERTYQLLEKERSEKNLLIRKIEKMERDATYYRNAIQERDNKIKILTARAK